MRCRTSLDMSFPFACSMAVAILLCSSCAETAAASVSSSIPSFGVRNAESLISGPARMAKVSIKTSKMDEAEGPGENEDKDEDEEDIP